jgi:hypothetical protein
MIHYDLRCGAGHDFDSWFKDSEAFAAQSRAGFVECPVCGSKDVSKRLMAPAIPKKGRSRAKEAPAQPLAQPPAPIAEAPPALPPPMPAQMVAFLQRVRTEIEKRADYVGRDFAEEARKIQRGESERSAIYGEASDADAEALRDEGIEVARIPWVPLAD